MARIDAGDLLQMSGEAAVDLQRGGDGVDQKIERTGHQHDQVAGLPMFLNRAHRRRGHAGTQLLPAKLLSQRLDHLGRFSCEVQLAFTERMEGQRRQVSHEPPKTRTSFGPSYHPTPPEPSEKSDFAGFAGKDGVVQIEKGRNLAVEATGSSRCNQWNHPKADLVQHPMCGYLKWRADSTGGPLH